jgi:hypothetical protein
LGHAFAGLADEYWAGDGYAAEAPNMTQTSQPNQVRWKNWIGESQIGVYQHGTSGIPALWYRPHQDCLMRYLNQDYCRVCAETVIEKIHQLTSPLTAYAPIDSLVSLSGTFVDFTLQTIQPEPNTLRTVWELDNKKLPLDQPCTESLRLYDTGLSAGRHTLKVTLEDTTTRVRVNYHGAKHFKTVWWNVSHTNGIRAQSSNQLTCRLYPNPVSDYLFLSLSVEKPEELSVQILTMGGKTVQKMKKTLLLDHERYETMIDLSDCPSGIYWVVIQLGEMFEYQKIVKPF